MTEGIIVTRVTDYQAAIGVVAMLLLEVSDGVKIIGVGMFLLAGVLGS